MRKAKLRGRKKSEQRTKAIDNKCCIRTGMMKHRTGFVELHASIYKDIYFTLSIYTFLLVAILGDCRFVGGGTSYCMTIGTLQFEIEESAEHSIDHKAI